MLTLEQQVVKEKFKDIQGFEGIYQISNIGRVISLPRPYSPHKRFLKYKRNNRGYRMVILRNRGINKTVTVHRLVAIAFVKNPKNLPCVNHKDGKRINNSYRNLEWCTYSQNNKHAYDIGLKKVSKNTKKQIALSNSKAIIQCNRNGIVLKRWVSSAEAARKMGITQSVISMCLTGKNKRGHEYIWKYAIPAEKGLLDTKTLG